MLSLLLAFVGAAIGFSFLCSILEASFLSARVTTLMERRDAGHRGAALLLHLKQQRVDDALSSILILNTVANTAGATLAGTQAEALWGDRVTTVFGFSLPWVGIFTAGLILSILVGSEIIPKTLGAVYSLKMVSFTAYAVRSLTWIFRPALRLTRIITGLLARGQEQPPISRRELAAMVTAATREGTLHAADSRAVSSVLNSHEIKVEDVMTPRMVIAMLAASTSIADFLEHESSRVFSRIPIFEDDRDNVIGFVFQRDVLAAAARGESRSTPLVRFARKALYVPEQAAVGRALRLMTRRREHMALVTDEYGGISGLVSLEDLVETTLGIEILDESDRVADLRAEAQKLREKRLEEFRVWRQAVVDQRDVVTSAAGEPAREEAI